MGMKRTIRLATVTALAAGASLAVAPVAANASTSIAPTSLNFGAQQVGTTSAGQTTTLTLTCSLPGPVCFILSEDFTPSINASPTAFRQTNNCPATMSAGGGFASPLSVSCQITVTFAPTAEGTVTGTLSTGMGGPTASLSGTAVPATATPAPAPAAERKKCKKGKKKPKGAAAAKKRKCGRKKRGK
jgi:hypothetical protein